MSAYHEILNQIQYLTSDEQFQLLEDLVSLVRLQSATHPLHSILELEGLGKETWEDVNVQQYIDQERDSWDG